MKARCHRCQTTRELQAYRIMEGDWTKPLLLCASCWRLPNHGMYHEVTLVPIAARRHPV